MTPEGHNSIKLENFPVEVLQIMMSKMSFVDLPYVLRASKCFDTVFKGHPLYKKFMTMSWRGAKNLHLEMKRFRDMWSYWTIEEVINKYTSEYCEHCGDFATVYMWLSIPTMKLCAHCIHREPKYSVEPLNETFEIVKDRRLKAQRKWKAYDKAAAIIDEHDMDKFYKNGFVRPRKCLIRMLRKWPEDKRKAQLFAGCIRVDFYLPEFDTHASRLCGHCEGIPLIRRDPNDTYPTLMPICAHGHIVKEVPNTVETMREHVARVHPHLLDSFDVGWAALSPALKERWKLRPAPSGRDKYRRSSKHIVAYKAWHSWTAFAYNEIRVKDWVKIHEYHGTDNHQMAENVSKTLTHPGELLDLPEEIDPLGPPWKISEQWDSNYGSSSCECLQPPFDYHRSSYYGEDPERSRLEGLKKAVAEKVMRRMVQNIWEKTYEDLLANCASRDFTHEANELYGSTFYSKLGRTRGLRYDRKKRRCDVYEHDSEDKAGRRHQDGYEDEEDGATGLES